AAPVRWRFARCWSSQSARRSSLRPATWASRSPTGSRSATGSTTRSATGTFPTWPRWPSDHPLAALPNDEIQLLRLRFRPHRPVGPTLNGMSRFFKSAAFPILIVVVLAFFAQKLIGSSSHTPHYTYGSLVQQLNNDQVATLQINDKDNTADVTTTRGAKYTVG